MDIELCLDYDKPEKKKKELQSTIKRLKNPDSEDGLKSVQARQPEQSKQDGIQEWE